MALYFITGNKNKISEVSAILPNVEQLDIDLPEVQDIDIKEIIKAKLLEALNHEQAEFIVEDTTEQKPKPLLNMQKVLMRFIISRFCQRHDYLVCRKV